MTTVNEHEYFKMMRAREDRIRTFMQLELEACLEEVSWSIRCYNCEALGCPQEEYPVRLLPTLPPNYEGNLQNRLIMAQKGIFPASLKMILKSEYQLPVLRPAPEISAQPDSVIGETSGRREQHVVRVRSIAATRRGRYEVRGTRNAAALARDNYGVSTRGIASRNANGG